MKIKVKFETTTEVLRLLQTRTTSVSVESRGGSNLFKYHRLWTEQACGNPAPPTNLQQTSKGTTVPIGETTQPSISNTWLQPMEETAGARYTEQ